MEEKILNIKKSFLILSGGVGLVIGINQYRLSEADKLLDRLKCINLDYDNFGGHFCLNSAYSNFVGELHLAASTERKYIMDEYDYKVSNFIPSLSNDLISYTFYDDYIDIKLFNDDGLVYSECRYNDDGTYSISCMNDVNYINTDRYITYIFSSDGVLTDSFIDGYSFHYINGNIDNYVTVNSSNQYVKRK